jgi:glutaminase
MQTILEEAVAYARNFLHQGKPASYIPELAKADPNLLGAAIVTVNGETFFSGDYEKSFTIQSISKPIALILALKDNSENYVFSRVGMEPTGDAFNSIIKLETEESSRPLNPMINAGAIAIDSFIKGRNTDVKLNRLLDFFRLLSHNPTLTYDKNVFNSESETGFRNRALANFMKDAGILEGNVEDVLELYFKQCSIEINCKDIATIATVLASNGISPFTNERVCERHYTRLVKTFMVTCGMYDASGEFAVKVGLPAKSGVGGGIMATVPDRMGIGVFSPGLDAKGNSVAGMKVLEYLSTRLDLSIF